MLNPYERLAFHIVGWFSLIVSLLYIYVFWSGFIDGIRSGSSSISNSVGDVGIGSEDGQWVDNNISSVADNATNGGAAAVTEDNLDLLDVNINVDDVDGAAL